MAFTEAHTAGFRFDGAMCCLAWRLASWEDLCRRMVSRGWLSVLVQHIYSNGAVPSDEVDVWIRVVRNADFPDERQSASVVEDWANLSEIGEEITTNVVCLRDSEICQVYATGFDFQLCQKDFSTSGGDVYLVLEVIRSHSKSNCASLLEIATLSQETQSGRASSVEVLFQVGLGNGGQDVEEAGAALTMMSLCPPVGKGK